MIDAYCHLDMSAAQPIADLERRMDAAGVDRALIIETWSGDNRICLQQLVASFSARFRVMFCFRPDDPQFGSELLSIEMVRGLRVKTQDLNRLGPIAARLESMGKWLLPHAESGIRKLADELLQLAARYPQLPIYLPHMGWPRRDRQDDDDWHKCTASLRKLPNVVVGVSAMAHFSRESFPHDDIAPFASRLLATFGHQSLVPASDYPLFEKDRYTEYMQLASSWISGSTQLGHRFESSLFGSNSKSGRVKRMATIGFIGIGVMGKPMAANLLRAGYSVSIVPRHPEKEAPLIEQGALTIASSQELARTSDVIILMLPDTNTVEHVLFGDDGIALSLRKGSVVIDMSTISPEQTVEFAARMAVAGCAMLDAPVSGGEKGAEAGTLGIMVGGPRDIFERCRPIFGAMGKTITYTGPSGCGQKTKLVNQLVGATNLLGAVEGLRLARAAGLDEQATLEAVSSGAASSWMLVNLGPKILQGDFAPGFSIRLQHKDVALVKDWLAGMSGDFPAASLVYSLFSEAMEAGLAEQGNQGLINIWQNGKRI